VWWPPAATAAAAPTADSSRGTVAWPRLLPPQHTTCASQLSAHVCSAPVADTAVKRMCAGKPDTAPAVSNPWHVSTPAVVSRHVRYVPALTAARLPAASAEVSAGPETSPATSKPQQAPTRDSKIAHAWKRPAETASTPRVTSVRIAGGVMGATASSPSGSAPLALVTEYASIVYRPPNGLRPTGR